MTTATPSSWTTPRRLMGISIGVALATIVLKTAAWWITGSVGLLSDALEAGVNLAGATFGLWMVIVAARPADDDHPFGHQKAEYFSSGFEGILIIAAALAIIWTALPRFWHPQPLQQIGLGTVLSLLSAALNGGLAWVMLGAARQHRSMALEGDARHLLTDVWTSVGVVIGVLVVALTGWLWLDPVAAIAVALNIAREGARLVWQSSQGLMDAAVPEEAQRSIDEVLARFVQRPDADPEVRVDHVRSRRAGRYMFLDVHLHLPGNWSLQHATSVRNELEETLMTAVPGLHSSIQLLPLHMESVAVEEGDPGVIPTEPETNDDAP